MIVPVAIYSILVPKFLPATGNYYHCILLHSLFFHFPQFVFIQVNSHCPRSSRALEKPLIDTEIVQEDASINS